MKSPSLRVQDTYQTANLRYSQMAPIDMYEEKAPERTFRLKSRSAQPMATPQISFGEGGGSANKSYLFQETKALLNEATLLPWIYEKMQSLGTAACPPYHLAIAIGGTSAEFAVETAKLASAKYLDGLPTSGQPSTRL